MYHNVSLYRIFYVLLMEIKSTIMSKKLSEEEEKESEKALQRETAYWAGQMHDLPKHIQWSIAEEIVSRIKVLEVELETHKAQVKTLQDTADVLCPFCDSNECQIIESECECYCENCKKKFTA